METGRESGTGPVRLVFIATAIIICVWVFGTTLAQVSHTPGLENSTRTNMTWRTLKKSGVKRMIVP